jgi:hypothetical protein
MLAIFLFCGVPSSAMLAIASGPDTMDAWAAMGAMLASALVAADASRKERSFVHLTSVVLSCAFVGSVGPGATGYYFFPDKMATFTWHFWAASGFVAGLGGFGLVHSITVLWGKYHQRIESGKIIPGFFDDDDNPRGGPPKKP